MYQNLKEEKTNGLRTSLYERWGLCTVGQTLTEFLILIKLESGRSKVSVRGHN